MISTEEQQKIIARVSMAALAIDPRNPRLEAVQLLKELNDRIEEIIEVLPNSKNEV